MIESMDPLVFHISDAELIKDVQAILQRVESGAEIIIATPPRRTISECIAMLSDGSTATIDPDFASDVEAAIAAHREPLEPPAWD
jgi:hypothetical protein